MCASAFRKRCSFRTDARDLKFAAKREEYWAHEVFGDEQKPGGFPKSLERYRTGLNGLQCETFVTVGPSCNALHHRSSRWIFTGRTRLEAVLLRPHSARQGDRRVGRYESDGCGLAVQRAVWPPLGAGRTGRHCICTTNVGSLRHQFLRLRAGYVVPHTVSSQPTSSSTAVHNRRVVRPNMETGEQGGLGATSRVSATGRSNHMRWPAKSS